MKLEQAKCIVIKIGSALVTENGKPRSEWLQSLTEDVATMLDRGQQVLLVSSGALALGRRKLGKTPEDALKIEEKQAAAACGQSEMIQMYQQLFESKGRHVGQMLLSLDDTENRRRYLNARNTLEALLEHGIVPIVNENDSITTKEMRFGDNDRLAARVAQMVEADMLILLSDVNGLYTANPMLDKNAKHIPVVEEITPEIEAMGGEADTHVGSGGMITKLIAAKIASESGCHMLIAKGAVNHPLSAIERGAQHTHFVAHDTPNNARKNWIAHSIKVMGKATIDGGAEKALYNGNSLLPVGVTEISGTFERGDCILILNKEGAEIGRGLSAYNSDDAIKIIGRQSTDIEGILGFSGRDALIHRNDMVLQ